MTTPKRAPVQDEDPKYHRPGYDKWRGHPKMPSGTVTWEEHLEAYAAYAKRYGHQQSAERLAERGGFGYYEISDLLGHEPKTWEPRSR